MYVLKNLVFSKKFNIITQAYSQVSFKVQQTLLSLSNMEDEYLLPAPWFLPCDRKLTACPIPVYIKARALTHTEIRDWGLHEPPTNANAYYIHVQSLLNRLGIINVRDCSAVIREYCIYLGYCFPVDQIDNESQDLLKWLNVSTTSCSTPTYIPVYGAVVFTLWLVQACCKLPPFNSGRRDSSADTDAIKRTLDGSTVVEFLSNVPGYTYSLRRWLRSNLSLIRKHTSKLLDNVCVPAAGGLVNLVFEATKGSKKHDEFTCAHIAPDLSQLGHPVIPEYDSKEWERHRIHAEAASNQEVNAKSDDEYKLDMSWLTRIKYPRPISTQERNESLEKLTLQQRSVYHNLLMSLHVTKKCFQGGRTFLISGPPGTGKTATVWTVCKLLNLAFVPISAYSFLSKFVGDSERLLKCIFEVAAIVQPAVVFIDECEKFLLDRCNSGSPGDHSVVGSFLEHLSDGPERHCGVAVVLCTNIVELIDNAIQSRCEKIIISAPTIAERITIWKTLFNETGRISIDYMNLRLLACIDITDIREMKRLVYKIVITSATTKPEKASQLIWDLLGLRVKIINGLVISQITPVLQMPSCEGSIILATHKNKAFLCFGYKQKSCRILEVRFERLNTTNQKDEPYQVEVPPVSFLIPHNTIQKQIWTFCNPETRYHPHRLRLQTLYIE
jgi:hypothetical protein